MSKDHVFLLLVEVLSTRTTPITVTVLDILKESCNLEIDVLEQSLKILEYLETRSVDQAGADAQK